jgi:hypothetical protein
MGAHTLVLVGPTAVSLSSAIIFVDNACLEEFIEICMFGIFYD